MLSENEHILGFIDHCVLKIYTFHFFFVLEVSNLTRKQP